jgi:hypothetical protein
MYIIIRLQVCATGSDAGWQSVGESHRHQWRVGPAHLPTARDLLLEGRAFRRLDAANATITLQLHVVAMSLENLNARSFVPVKDHDKDRLVSGLLQLANGTQLVLDETALHEGQLTEIGTLSQCPICLSLRVPLQDTVM